MSSVNSILDAIQMYQLDNESLTDKDKEALENMGYDTENPDIIVSLSDLEQLPGYFGNLKYDYVFDDDYEYKLLLDDFIKNADTYLIAISTARWNGASGYRIVNDKEDIFERDYDITQYDTKSLHRKKVMTWTEASHDVPMGSTAVAVALTKREAERMQNALDAEDFKSINAFVEKYTA